MSKAEYEDAITFDNEDQRAEYENAKGLVRKDLDDEEASDGEIIEQISRAYTGRL